jgi:hypothetical protein
MKKVYMQPKMQVVVLKCQSLFMVTSKVGSNLKQKDAMEIEEESADTGFWGR